MSVSSAAPFSASAYADALPAADRRLPVGREFFLMENAGGRLGYDPVPGLDGSIARNDYSNVPEELAQMFKAAQAKPKKTGATQ